MAKALFRNKEKRLYEISDYIGCMSPANVDYLLKNNEIDSNKVEVCPNSIKVEVDISVALSADSIAKSRENDR